MMRQFNFVTGARPAHPSAPVGLCRLREKDRRILRAGSFFQPAHDRRTWPGPSHRQQARRWVEEATHLDGHRARRAPLPVVFSAAEWKILQIYDDGGPNRSTARARARRKTPHPINVLGVGVSVRAGGSVPNRCGPSCAKPQIEIPEISMRASPRLKFAAKMTAGFDD
jgi:hypothetical protein